jgi:hypothetical protein
MGPTEEVQQALERAKAAIKAADATRDRIEARREAERLRREGHGARPAERTGKLGEDRQVGVQPDPLNATDAKRR